MGTDEPKMPEAVLTDLTRIEDIADWVVIHSAAVNIPDGLVSIEHLNRALAQAFRAGRRAPRERDGR